MSLAFVMRSARCALATGMLIVAAVSPSLAQQASDHHAAYDTLLGRYVTTGTDGVNRVDYARWHQSGADRRALDAYISGLTALRPSDMSHNDALAYWGNLYNAITLKVVLDRYPVASIRDIKSENWLDPKAYAGPWRQKRVTVEGKYLSLDDIEHDIVRPVYKDPRIHYVGNCASFGCPNLMNRAWRGETIEADLDAAARAYINHPRGVTVLARGKLKVSSIFKWFKADFGGTDEALLVHFKTYADPTLANQLTDGTAIIEDAYDWSLNSVQSKSSS